MKRARVDIKKTIKKKIEYKHASVKTVNKMNNRSNLRAYGDPNVKPKGLHVELIGREERRSGVVLKQANLSVIRGEYNKKIFVDYDVVICIPSHERYKKVKRLISQFYEQPTKYSFKIVLLNDGSKSMWYDKLPEQFPEIIYLKNNKPNGKILHWYCYNQMWEHLKNTQCHVVLQMDDDFILSDNFLDTIIDLFFIEKEKNNRVMAIAPHLWSFKKYSKFESWWNRLDFVDGIALIDDKIIKQMEYEMKVVDADEVCKAGVPVRAWTQINDAIVKTGGIIYRTENSLVYHDGNDDSKLHSAVRGNGKGVFTQKYIGKL